MLDMFIASIIVYEISLHELPRHQATTSCVREGTRGCEKDATTIKTTTIEEGEEVAGPIPPQTSLDQRQMGG